MMISNVSNPIEISRFARVSHSITQIRHRAQYSSGYRPRWLATRTGLLFKEISIRHSSYGGGGFRALCASETSPSTSSTAEEGGGQAEESEGHAEAMKLFEEIRNAERKRVEKQEEFEHKANLQLERQIIMASNWSRALLKLRGKLKGTEWDPENSHKIDYSDFLRLLDSNSVQYMEYSDFGQKVSVILPYFKEEEAKEKKTGTTLKREIVYKRHIIERMPVDCWNDVWKKLHQQLVNVDVINVDPVPVEIYSTISIAVIWGMRFALAVGLYLWIDSVMRPMYETPFEFMERRKPLRKRRKFVSRRKKSEGSIGKSRAVFISAEEKTGVTFDDFAGQEYIKQDLKEIVHILKNEEMYKAKGLYCPKGVLLYGPPGTGKTLLAKAIAGEAGLPFFATTGADFVEMFAGVAASRVKDLFANARSNAPAIIFIDEIDAIGCRRGGEDAGGGGIEREQGLLQLLTEMDGFKVSKEQVLVIGATNRVDILDPALVRKGRFDRIVRVGLPSKEGRLAILKVHARNKNFRSEEEKDALLEEVAAKTEDFSGAELQNILNEAGILTARKDEDYIRREELMEALTRQDGTFETGQEDVVEVPEDLRVRVAYREAAIAVLSCYYPDSNHRFIWTHIMDMDDEPNAEYTKHRGEIFLKKSDYVRSIVRSCAPRVIEELIFGLDKLSWTAAPSTSEAAATAEILIMRTGMTAFGLPYYRNYGDFVTNLVPKFEALREEYVRFGVAKCTSVLREYHEAVESIADVLLEEGAIGAEKVLEICNLSPRAPQPPVAPADEYGALMYAGRWGIYGVTLPGRVTFAPGNMGFATFGAPRPVKVTLMRPVLEYVDDMMKRPVEIKDEVADTEQPAILMASHFL